MAVLGQDLFTEVSTNVALGSHTPLVGAGWAVSAAQFTVLFAPDVLQHNRNAIDYARKGDDIGADEMDVSASVSVAGASIRIAGVCARMSTDNYANQYEAFLQYKTTTTQDVFLFKNVGGTRTQLGTAVVTLNQNVQTTLKLAIRAGTQEVFVGGVSRIATTEPDATLSGRHYAGVIMNGNNSGNALVDTFLSESVAAPAAALEGDATGTAASAGALTTGIPLEGASAGLASSAGALTTAIPLGAQAPAIATAAGALTTGLQLAASASVAVTTAGDLTTTPGGVGLTAAAAGTVTATGALSTAVPLGGAATGQAASAAALLTAIPLEGAAAATVTAAADLTVGGMGLTGAAASTATGTASLTTGIVLTAAVLGRALALGSLSVLVADQEYDGALWGALTMRQATAGTLTPRTPGSGPLTMRLSSFGAVAVLGEE